MGLTKTDEINIKLDKPIFQCKNLTKEFGNIKAIDNFTYTSKTNAIGLFGPNGSGKSTLIKMIMGLIRPTYGTIELGLKNNDIRFIPDFPTLPHSYTIDQWMDQLEMMFGDISLDIDIQEITKLESEYKIKNLSAGQYRLAALLPIFYGKPKLIVLDEPSNYLDMILRDRMIELIQDVLKKTRSKLIMASHRMDEISAFSHSVIMLNKGTLVAEVSMSLENRNLYAIRVDNSMKLRDMIDKTTIEYEMKSTMLGPTLIVLMSWNLWKILHRFTKEGGIIYGLNIVNEFEDKLGEIQI